MGKKDKKKRSKEQKRASALSAEMDQAYLNALRNLGPAPTQNDFLNSDIYKQNLDASYKLIGDQETKDFADLQNNLAARNLLGGSFDAYSNDLLKKDYGNQRLNAQTNALNQSADQLTNQYNSRLNALFGFSNISPGSVFNRSRASYQPYQPQSAGLGGGLALLRGLF